MTSTLTPTDQPAITKRVGEYDPTTKQYPAYVAIDGEPEQLVGVRWSAGAADRCADEYIFQYYVDHHTPEAAARIALAFEPEQGHRTICSAPGCSNPATKIGLNDRPMCDACDAAGLERLRRAIFEPSAELDEQA